MGNANTHKYASPADDDEEPPKSFRVVDQPVETFSGRREILTSLHKELHGKLSERNFLKRVVVLVGPTGMGKSEIARKLVQEHENQYENVAWINADTEISTKESFHKIACALKIRHHHREDAEGRQLAELVYHHLDENIKKRALFIFDNAAALRTEESAFGILEYLPSQMSNCSPLILVTSQTAQWTKHGCSVIQVTRLSKEESSDFLRSRFSLSSEEIGGYSELQDLFDKFVKILYGYPFVLALAAATIVDKKGTLKEPELCPYFLKILLQRYILRMEEAEIHEQLDINSRLDPTYAHTLMKVWDIAVSDLETRRHGKDAKYLLRILAYCSQDIVKGEELRRIYAVTWEKFGVTIPDLNSKLKKHASFEQALHPLYSLGLIRLHNETALPAVKGRQAADVRVHRLVRTLAKCDDESSFGIQKVLLFCLTVHHVELREEHLWGKGVPRWAVENEWKALLWLYGLRCLRKQGCERVVKTQGWKKVLEMRLPNGGDIAQVAEFIVNNQFPQRASLDCLHTSAIWRLIGNVVKVKSSLVRDSADTRVFLELMVLVVLGDALEIMGSTFSFASDFKAWSCPSKQVLNSFQQWLCHFDYFTAMRDFGAEQTIYSIIFDLILLSKCSPLALKGIKLVTPKAIFKLQDDASKLRTCGHMTTVHSTGFRATRELHYLYEIWDPEDVQEMVQDCDLLSRLSQTLTCPDSWCFYSPSWILRQLVWKSNCVQHVTEHQGLMERLKNCPLWAEKFNAVRPEIRVKCSEITEQAKEIFPGLEGRIWPCYDYTTRIMNMYHFLIVCFAMYATLNPSKKNPIEWSLAEFLPEETCKRFLAKIAYFDIVGIRRLTAYKLPIQYVLRPHESVLRVFSCKADLEEDKAILSRALEKLEREDGPGSGRTSDWNSSFYQLVRNLQKLNERLLTLLKDLESPHGDDSSVDELNSASY